MSKFSWIFRLVVWLDDREIFSQLPCRKSSQSSRLPLNCYWGPKIKFVVVWATIQRSPELCEWFRHDHLLSRVLQPARGFVVFLSRLLQPSWLWFVVKHICCTLLSSTGQSRGRSNQPQSTGKLSGTVVFCSTCASSTTPTLIWRCCRRSTSASVRRLDWQKQTSEVLQEYCRLINNSSSFCTYREAMARTTQPCIPYL